MWLFTLDGFCSVVQDKRNAKHIHVRFRLREDAERMAEKLDAHSQADAPAHRVLRTDDADYRFRIITFRTTLARVMYAQVMDLDYENFKGACHGDPDRDTAYMGCWSAMNRLQNTRHPREPIGGRRRRPRYLRDRREAPESQQWLFGGDPIDDDLDADGADDAHDPDYFRRLLEKNGWRSEGGAL